MTPRAAPPATDRCPRCDASFGCGVWSGDCWCSQLELSRELQTQLAADYDGCLCPACLRELAPPS